MNTFDNDDTDDDGLPIETYEYESYESLLVHKLMWLGLSREQAEQAAADRWPMDAASVSYECRGRGLELTRDDLTAFLHRRYRRTHFADGEPIKAGSVAWIPETVDALLDWAFEEGRGSTPDEDALDADDADLAAMPIGDMLGLLRSGELPDRITGAVCLTLVEDGELVRQRAPFELIRRAVRGDVRAVDRLETIVAARGGP
jgi:hypothetical protein